MGYNEDPQSLHKYAYSECDPVNGSDPSGMLTCAEVVSVTFNILTVATMVLSAISIGKKIAEGRIAEISIWDILGLIPFEAAAKWVGMGAKAAYGAFVAKGLDTAMGYRAAGALTSLGEKMAAAVGRAKGGYIGQLGTQFHNYVKASWLGKGFRALKRWGNRVGIQVYIDEGLPGASGPGSRPDFTILVPKIGMAFAIDIKPVPKTVWDQGFIACYNYLLSDTSAAIGGRRDGTLRHLGANGYRAKWTWYLYIPYPSFAG